MGKPSDVQTIQKKTQRMKEYDFIIEGKIKAKDRLDAGRIMIEKLSCKEIAAEKLMQFIEHDG
jgi:hypothetical protein